MIIKPEALHYSEKIIKRLEENDINILETIDIAPSIDMVMEHYREYRERDFFYDLCHYIANSEVKVIVVDISPRRGRRMLLELRKEFGIDSKRNGIHASYSEEEFYREYSIWFKHYYFS